MTKKDFELTGELAKKIIRDCGDSIFITNSKGNVVYINKGATDIFGYQPEEVVGRSVLGLYPRNLSEEREKWIEETEKEQKKVKTKVYGSDGNIKHILLTLYRVENDEDLLIGVSKDITEEEELKEIQKISSDTLVHDISNPAGVVKNLTEMLLELEEKDTDKKVLYKYLNKSAKKIINIADKAVEYARLKETKELSYESIDLKKIIDGSISNFERVTTEKEINIENYINGVNIKGSPLFIESVFDNLISNAIKYGDNKNKIVIDAQEIGNKFRISIADKGEGIPDKYKENIFHRFERVGKEGVKGTGLGLAIVKNIIESQHNGKIWVEDNEGGGSIFYVELPKE